MRRGKHSSKNCIQDHPVQRGADFRTSHRLFLDTLTDPGGSEAKIRPVPVCPAAEGMWSGYEAFF